MRGFCKNLSMLLGLFSNSDENISPKRTKDKCRYVRLEETRKKLADEKQFKVRNDSTKGFAFENDIAALIRRNGMYCESTKGGSDQGVDLIVSIGSTRVAVQCKNWTGKVGNGAVQAVFAGAKYYNCKIACVVAVGGYTSSAIELAHSIHVELLDSRTLLQFLSSFRACDKNNEHDIVHVNLQTDNQVVCPNCGHCGYVPNEYFGKRIHCSKCKNIFLYSAENLLSGASVSYCICKKCGHRLTIPNSPAGVSVVCGNCGSTLQVWPSAK